MGCVSNDSHLAPNLCCHHAVRLSVRLRRQN